MKNPAGRRDMRKFDRRFTSLPVTIGAPDGARSKASITLDAADVSEGGAFLLSDLLFELGETLSLEIPLPSGQVLKAHGRVARVVRAATAAGMGIEFLDLPLTDRRALSASLTKLSVTATPGLIRNEKKAPAI